MSIKHIAATALVGALLAGCNMPTPGQPGTTTSPAPGASASPAASVGGSVSTGTGATTGAASALWTVGKKWTYKITSKAAGQTTESTMTREILKVEGTKATVKTTIKAGTAPESSSTAEVDTATTTTVDASKPNQQEGVTTALKSTTKESVTVAAGTYADATKYVYDMTGKVQGTSTAWVNETVGLIKSVSEIKPEVPAGVPAGIDLTSTTTIELQSVK